MLLCDFSSHNHKHLNNNYLTILNSVPQLQIIGKLTQLVTTFLNLLMNCVTLNWIHCIQLTTAFNCGFCLHTWQCDN